MRGGYAYAVGASLHGRGPTGHWKREATRTWCWVIVIPTLAVSPAWSTGGWSLLLLACYLWPLSRAFRHRRVNGATRYESWLYAVACLVAKFAELAGQLRFLIVRLMGRKERIIEYKVMG